MGLLKRVEDDRVVEAGTGVGKSLAYLIPAVLWAKRQNKKAVISTHTINLQEQLVFKDIPIVRKVLSEEAGDFSALLKLGANYQIYDPGTIQAAAGGRFSRRDGLAQ